MRVRKQIYSLHNVHNYFLHLKKIKPLIDEFPFMIEYHHDLRSIESFKRTKDWLASHFGKPYDNRNPNIQNERYTRFADYYLFRYEEDAMLFKMTF